MAATSLLPTARTCDKPWQQSDKRAFLNTVGTATLVCPMTTQVSLEQLKVMLVDKLNLKSVTVDQIADDNALFGPEGLGLDSVDALELVLAIESEFGIQIQDEEVGRDAFVSVQVLGAFINARLADGSQSPDNQSPDNQAPDSTASSPA